MSTCLLDILRLCFGCILLAFWKFTFVRVFASFMGASLILASKCPMLLFVCQPILQCLNFLFYGLWIYDEFAQNSQSADSSLLGSRKICVERFTLDMICLEMIEGFLEVEGSSSVGWLSRIKRAFIWYVSIGVYACQDIVNLFYGSWSL